jgi:NAD(P)-dependent dehydrogenase (short-subunit alcohol dehydrogenase family)
LTPVDAHLSGRTCVVTGASAGIGRATAHALARLGARVVLAVRNPQKGEKVLHAIARATGNTQLEIATVDFARAESIRTFARDLATRHPKIHVLVNNAGIWSNRRQLGPDGIELVWATNVLGYFLTTELLLPQLRAAGRARVVNVASRYAGGLDLADVQFERRPWAGKSAYAQSKQANRMWTWALSRRLEGTGVTANALHPGFVSTEIFQKGGGVLAFAIALIAKLRARRPAEGADTAVWLAASPEVDSRSGIFWVDRHEHPCRFRDESAEEELWRMCRRMSGQAPPPAAAPGSRESLAPRAWA